MPEPLRGRSPGSPPSELAASGSGPEIAISPLAMTESGRGGSTPYRVGGGRLRLPSSRPEPDDERSRGKSRAPHGDAVERDRLRRESNRVGRWRHDERALRRADAASRQTRFEVGRDGQLEAVVATEKRRLLIVDRDESAGVASIMLLRPPCEVLPIRFRWRPTEIPRRG